MTLLDTPKPLVSSTMDRLRTTILRTAIQAGEGHIPSALSILDIVYVLYTEIMTQDDRFVLSKGHGALALYAVLAEIGVIPSRWLDSFCRPGAALQGHPESSAPGVEFSSGSLGHGICGAVGMAYAKKLRKKPGRVFCLIGDGEAQEGSVWEALRIADDLDLGGDKGSVFHLGEGRLTVIVDLNEPEREQHARRLEAFCHYPYTVWNIDGHDHEAIRTGLQVAYPIVFANTVKGHGVPCMEADPKAWHHRTAGLSELLERS